MIFIPAIDLIDGKCVRLYMGDYSRKKEYADDPVEVAGRFRDEGAEYLHIVDLDAAKDPQKNNLKTIERIVKSVDIPVEVGGGIRTAERVKELRSIGVKRIIIGTMLVRNPDAFKELVEKYPELIAASIDAKNGTVYISGWTESGGLDAIELGKMVRDMGVGTIIYTNISRDGTLEGPDVDGIRRMAEETGVSIIAAGGISSIEDLRRIKQLEKYGVIGVISGKAIYEKRFTVRQAVEVLN